MATVRMSEKEALERGIIKVPLRVSDAIAAIEGEKRLSWPPNLPPVPSAVSAAPEPADDDLHWYQRTMDGLDKRDAAKKVAIARSAAATYSERRVTRTQLWMWWIAYKAPLTLWHIGLVLLGWAAGVATALKINGACDW